MNIFPLEHRLENESISDWCSRIAHSHCDQHNKLILEAWQMLNTNCNLLGIPTDKKSKAYFNHPCTEWARSSTGNWQFLMELADALAMDMAERYGNQKLHNSAIRIHDNIPQNPTESYKGTKWLRDASVSVFATAIPDSIKLKHPCTFEGAVNAYREYYSSHKAFFARKGKSEGKYIIYPASWKHGDIPEWFTPPTVDDAIANHVITGTRWDGKSGSTIITSSDMVENYEDIKDYVFPIDFNA